MTREEIIDFLCDGEDYACPFMQDFQAEYVVDFVIKNYITGHGYPNEKDT